MSFLHSLFFFFPAHEAHCINLLLQDMEREIENVLSCGPEDEVLSSAFQLKITRGDIQTLRNQHWLNDVVKMKFG